MPLINPQALALLRSNAYNAARALDPKGDVTTLYTISNDYVKLVQPRINHALSTQQIEHDPQFLMIVDKVKRAAAGDMGATGSGILGTVESVVLVVGLGLGGWWLYKKYGKKWLHKKSKRHSSKRRKSGGGLIASLSSTSGAKVGA